MCLAYQIGSKTPSEIARSWQGTGKYPGIDDYVDITVEKGTVLYLSLIHISEPTRRS